MASTREIRRRIKSVKSTAQITKAMQLVAAAKMRKAQEAALAGKAYAKTLWRVLAAMEGKIDVNKHPLLVEHETGDSAVVFFSSDRGLAGALNANLFREAEKLLAEALYITLGKKGKDYTVKTRKHLVADFPAAAGPDFLLAKQITKLVLDDYKSGKLKQVSVLYADFVNTLKQQPKVVHLLPIKADQLQSEEEKHVTGNVGEYLFEPNIDELLGEVLLHYVEMTIYQALLEAQASEHSARMIAMKNATDNANDLVADLTLTYNQVRQDAITKELLEITTAAAALS